MRDDFPRPVPGRSLADLRKKVGIRQDELADRLGMHRVTLSGIEHSPTVTPVLAARYQNALAELVAEAVAPSEVA
jgi:transcriptional regulator with XRE-family HTH domain